MLVLNSNCSCNYVPYLFKHVDMGDIAALIAPRPLLVQSCRDDSLNGSRGMAIVQAAYGRYGKGHLLIHDVREGGHCFHPEPLQETPEYFSCHLSGGYAVH